MKSLKFEEPLIIRKTPLLILMKIIIIAILFNLVFIITSLIYVYLRQYYWLPIVKEYIVFILLVIIEILIFIKIIVYWLTEYMYVNDIYILHKRGLFNIAENRYNLDKINHIDIHQSVIWQLLRYGDIQVSLTNEKSIIFYSIPYPKQFVFLIEQKMQIDRDKTQE
jgi:uncharacterized membrane protein YdbT with pleckstrin-like domain